MSWAEHYKEIKSVLPCSELHIALYLQHLTEISKHHSTVESAFYSIKWAHDMAGLHNPCKSDFLRNIVESAKRTLSRTIKKKEPISPDLMKMLFQRFDTCDSTLKDLRLLVMCSLCYTGFLRYDELSNIRSNNLTFHKEHVDIFIIKSKTDCYRNGKNVFIAKLNSPYCPVSILQRYISLAGIDLDSDMFLFRSISFMKKSNTFILRKKNEKLSYTRTREIVRSALATLGVNIRNFGLHSLRSGGATAACKFGISDRLFKIHGRWKSENAKDGYVCEDLQRKLSVSKNLGL